MANKQISDLGKRIQIIVEEQGIKKNEFARSLGVSPNYIYQIVSGKRTSISPSLAKLIETLYDYPSGWVLNGTLEADARSEVIRRLEHMDIDKVRRVQSLLEEMDSNQTGRRARSGIKK